MRSCACPFGFARRTRRYWRDRSPATASSQPAPFKPRTAAVHGTLRTARQRQSADNFVAGKELGDLDRRRLLGVRTMHRVLANRLRMNLADRAIGGLRRVGRAHHVAVFEN